ncbi:DUF4136 domain-containing protein [Mariniradius sediminis]|uniref:DUF4136 domain-containing protein n=1 Tax=Mariniradius sediminis TaxID=2909237 RepID=A0ABS9BV01_9BACT|nr:DUF4136 domain-containing protein [Mariniradius sediminis]MCF1751848.1 DUF4136 domain-containing protein [Mariniradius sediminis]
MKLQLQRFFLGIGMTAMLACAPELPQDSTSLDVVYTNYNPDYSFGQGRTFALPENVIILSDVPPVQGQRPPFLEFATGRSIINAIRSNMVARGFTPVTQFDNPDYVILPSMTDQNELLFSYNWWFWDWWIPNLGTNLRWQYPGFQPAVVQSVSTGSILLQFVDMKTAGTGGQVEVNWVSVINGAITGSASSNTDRAVIGVNQAFTQSPYIRR